MSLSFLKPAFLKYLDSKKINKKWFIFFILLLILIFSRFYQLEGQLPFGWDQVRDAWVMKDIILEGKWPLLGPIAKGGNFYLGPAYFYFLVPFYYIFNLEPIASGVFAGIVSIVTFLTLFFVSKRIFSFNVALMAVFIYTVSFYVIGFDRLPWNVNLIPLVSLIIFYSLYRIGREDFKFIPVLALVSGFASHVHFTATFYPLIVLLTFPTLPFKRKVLKWAFFSLPLFFIWFIPNLISELKIGFIHSKNIFEYFKIYHHGFHLRRVFQLLNDVLIEFETLLTFKVLKMLKFILPFLFFFSYTVRNLSKRILLVSYLIFLWFAVTLVGFSLYSGEISSYYFSLTRPIAIMILAYLTVELFKIKNLVLKTALIGFWLVYFLVNTHSFLKAGQTSFLGAKASVKQAIEQGKTISFKEGEVNSYLYYIYTYRR